MIRVLVKASTSIARAGLESLLRAHPSFRLVPESSDGYPADGPALESQPDVLLIEALTPREIEVLRLLAAGLGNKEIASRLAISEHTVKFHVSSIMGKLGAASRTEAVTLGIRHGLIMI